MSLKFRRSFKLAPGIKLNIGKKSGSLTFGGRLLRKTVNTKGQVTTSGSIPGTGVYWSERDQLSNGSEDKSVDNLLDNEEPKHIGALLMLILSAGLLVCMAIKLIILATTDWMDPSDLKATIIATVLSALVALLSSNTYFRSQ